jgi:hypothetical protein
MRAIPVLLFIGEMLPDALAIADAGGAGWVQMPFDLLQIAGYHRRPARLGAVERT